MSETRKEIDIDAIVEELRQFITENLHSAYRLEYGLILSANSMPNVTKTVEGHRPQYVGIKLADRP